MGVNIAEVFGHRQVESHSLPGGNCPERGFAGGVEACLLYTSRQRGTGRLFDVRQPAARVRRFERALRDGAEGAGKPGHCLLYTSLRPWTGRSGCKREKLYILFSCFLAGTPV